MPRDKLFQSISVHQAGKKGGLVVLSRYGRKHFSTIGIKGQKTLRERYPGMAKVWGSQGGRPRKLNLNNTGDQDNNKRGGSGSASLNLIPHQSNYNRNREDQQDINGQ